MITEKNLHEIEAQKERTKHLDRHTKYGNGETHPMFYVLALVVVVLFIIFYYYNPTGD